MNHPVFIVCEMLEDEIHFIYQKYGLDFPIIWMDRGLHDYPDKLRKTLQEKIDEVNNQGYDGILLGFMLCGNALDGIMARDIPIVFPKYHDCIDMELSEPRDSRAFYMTAGWLGGSVALQNIYEQARERYGEKKAKRFLDLTLANYTSLTMIDTGAYPYEETLAIPRKLSELTGLPLKKCKGNFQVLEDFLTGRWDDRFYIVQPGETLSAAKIIDVIQEDNS